MFPIAYAYPKAKRAVRDLFRRRLFFVRQRAELSVHLQNTNHQYNINERLRWHDIKGWEKVVLWFDGIREPAEGSNYW